MQFVRPRRAVSRVFLHCSASDVPEHDNVATMDLWHRQRGWAGVGYHFFIRKNGLIERGRDLEKTPAAHAPHNRGTIAICCHGLNREAFTVEQFAALIDLCHQIDEAYDGKVTFHGHREVAARTCPVFDYRGVLGLDAQGRLGLPRPEILPAKPAAAEYDELPREPAPTVLRTGSRGAAVEALQRRLSALGYHLGAIDGQFGKLTRAALLAFQADNDLITDGLAGPATYEALEDAEPRQLSPKRTGITRAELASTSRIARASLLQKLLGFTTAGGGGLSLLSQTAGEIGKIGKALSPVKQLLSDHPLLITGLVTGLGLIIAWQAWIALSARLEDERSGKTL